MTSNYPNRWQVTWVDEDGSRQRQNRSSRAQAQRLLDEARKVDPRAKVKDRYGREPW